MPYNRYSHSFKIAYNKSAVSLLKSGEYIVYKGDQQHRQMGGGDSSVVRAPDS